MQPSNEFWQGLGSGLSNAEGNLIVALVGIVAVLFVVVKWGMPLYTELKEKRLEIERYKIEVKEKSDKALDERERERIKVTQNQIKSQEDENRILENLANTQKILVSQLDDSKTSSHIMGQSVSNIKDKTEDLSLKVDHISDNVDDIHDALFTRREGTD